MHSANEILIRLAEAHPGSIAIDDLAPYPPKTPERQLILQAVGTLLGRKLAVRDAGCDGIRYLATMAGVAFVRAGKTVASGPTGPHTGVRKQKETFRADLWRAIRQKRKVTVSGLLELAMPDGSDAARAQRNVQTYLNALAKVRIVTALEIRAGGDSPFSRGCIRYALLRDLGPQAPQLCLKKGFVFDPNSRERIAFPEKISSGDAA